MSAEEDGRRDRTLSEGGSAWGRTSFHAVDGLSSEKLASKADRLSLQISTTTTFSNMWSKIGTISDRASEVLEDARLTFHGKEKRLYDASVHRLSVSNHIALSTLGERVSLGRVSMDDDSLVEDIKAAQDMVDRASIDITMTAMETHWKGTLIKRSEWLRRWEKYYFVLDGIELKSMCARQYRLVVLIGATAVQSLILLSHRVFFKKRIFRFFKHFSDRRLCSKSSKFSQLVPYVSDQVCQTIDASTK